MTFCILVVNNVKGNVIKDIINSEFYEFMENSLNDQMPGEEYRVKCIIDDLRHKNMAEELYTFDIVFNPHQVDSRIQPYIDDANFKCFLAASIKNISEYIIALLPFVVAFFVVCLLLYCIFKIFRYLIKRDEIEYAKM